MTSFVNNKDAFKDFEELYMPAYDYEESLDELFSTYS